MVNRAGFSKLFMDHSDKMWARGKVDINYLTHYPNFAISPLIPSAAFFIFSSSTGLQDMMKYVLKRGGKMGTSFQVKVHLKARIFL